MGWGTDCLLCSTPSSYQLLKLLLSTTMGCGLTIENVNCRVKQLESAAPSLQYLTFAPTDSIDYTTTVDSSFTTIGTLTLTEGTWVVHSSVYAFFPDPTDGKYVFASLIEWNGNIADYYNDYGVFSTGFAMTVDSVANTNNQLTELGITIAPKIVVVPAGQTKQVTLGFLASDTSGAPPLNADVNPNMLAIRIG